VRTSGAGGRFEKKVDLPETWVRGFLQVQAAMGMPGTRISVKPIDLLAAVRFLRNTKAKVSPRGIRYEFEPGRDTRLVLEPWEKRLDAPGTRYEGPSTAPIRIWGTRRLLVLARMLPIADSIDVCLLATGLPSFWLVRMGEMVFTLGLSGWTTNEPPSKTSSC
jgi:hypothetical protein